jgi:hypothetical protein
VILLCGIPTEEPVDRVRQELDSLGLPYDVFDQRAFARAALAFEVVAGRVTGRLTLEGRRHRLEDVTGVYIRLMDHRLLPEVRRQGPASPAGLACQALHQALGHWCEIAPARVLNRSAPMASNFSKPYQAQLIRAEGFEVPETLITNDPDLVHDFRRRHGRVIYKSISGVRSIVRTLEEEDLARLGAIRWCPTQFQAFVPGANIRVHVVGTEVFATAIATEATDYRYAHRDGDAAELTATTLPGAWSDRCVRLARALRLDFAGIDLKITPDGRVVCFEVNPSPAYSYYEAHTGQPIANAVARYLAGR